MGESTGYVFAKKKITLSKTKREVEIREPSVADQLAVSHIDNDQLRGLALLANLTGINEDELRILPLTDYRELDDAAMDFIYGDDEGFLEK